MAEKNRFEFIYSAAEQEEIKKLREKYIEPQKKECSIENLRRLDWCATQKATALSLAVGIIGALILGLGMSLIMSDFGGIFGSIYISFALGILLGVIGIVFVIMAYPLYHRTLKKEREKIAPEIIRISDELLK